LQHVGTSILLEDIEVGVSYYLDSAAGRSHLPAKSAPSMSFIHIKVMDPNGGDTTIVLTRAGQPKLVKQGRK